MKPEEDFVDISFMLHCAVYALLKNGTVVYVGQSKKPLTRLYSHAHARGRLEPWRAGYKQQKVGFQFDAIWIRPCMLAELDSLEARMITKYQPKHNVKGRPRPEPEISLMDLITNGPVILSRVPPVALPSWRRF